MKTYINNMSLLLKQQVSKINSNDININVILFI